MKIAFLLGSTGISGGTNVILEHAGRLQRAGDDVFLITEHEAFTDEFYWHSGAEDLQLLSLKEAEDMQFDCVLATWWQSVSLLSRVSATSYLYFVQSIESRFFPEEDNNTLTTRDIDVIKQWIESTYRFPLSMITEATWIQNYLRREYNHNPILVRNGIRKDIYSAEGPSVEPRTPGTLRVLVEGPLGVFYKNVEKTVELCRQAGVEDIWLLTSSEINVYPGVDRIFSQVSIADTANIYRSCDVLVKLSTVEGMFGPPLEMFHCGGTAIVYDVTGHDEYIVHRRNGLVVRQGGDDKVVSYLKELMSTPELLTALKSGAAETAAEWPDWTASSKEFSRAVKDLCQKEHFVTKQLLETHNNYYLTVRENSFRACEMKRFAEREGTDPGQNVRNINHIQVYWHYGGGFTNENMTSSRYHDNEWCRCRVVLPSMDKPAAIRVDPGVRVGIIAIREIAVIDEANGRTLKRWNLRAGFNSLRLGGTARLISIGEFYTILAHGEDPQLILPGVYSLESGRIVVEVEVLDRGIREWCLEADRERGVKSKLKHLLARAGKIRDTNK